MNLWGSNKGQGPSAPLMRNAQFRYFISARAISLFGSAMTPVALAFAVLERYGPRALGPVLAAQMIPLILFIVIGGGVADRFNRSTVLVYSNLVAGFTQCVIATVLISHAPVYWVVSLAVFNGTAEAFTTPALRGILPDIVPQEQFPQANSLLSTTRNVAKILGPTLAGVLIAVANGSTAIALDGATFIVAAFLMNRLHTPGRVRQQTRSL